MADLPDLIAQLRAAAEDATKGEWIEGAGILVARMLEPRHDCFIGRAEAKDDAAYIIAAQPQNITRILDAYAEMERALQTLVKYADWQMREGADYHPTLPSAVSAARAALQQKDKADE